jgi:hypothetical protein
MCDSGTRLLSQRSHDRARLPGTHNSGDVAASKEET